MEEEQSDKPQLKSYLSPVMVWALSFGCAVGWGAFVMPGTLFLPAAGPIGTLLGLGIGAVIMWVIGRNYYVLMSRYPDAGGVYTYTREIFGYDHAFLNAWFLILEYLAVAWANMTAVILIGRNIFGDVLEVGFHYQLAGFDVYLGELLTEIALFVLCGLICAYRKRLAAHIQVVAALILFAGIACFTLAATAGEGASVSLRPAFADTGHNVAGQILAIMALAPWTFVGFESISHSAQEFAFPIERTRRILTISVLAGALAYMGLSLVAVSGRPSPFFNWQQYIGASKTLEGRASMPVLYVIETRLGQRGMYILGLVILCGVVTGIIGNMIAASRLMYSLARDRILPQWFSIRFILAVSLVIPFFGRTALGWIVDVTTVCATVAYAYVSLAVYVRGRDEDNRADTLCGMIGLVSSVLFCLYLLVPNLWSVSTLAAESYLILAVWGILGFVFFRIVFTRDEERHFGRSTVVWIAMLFLIFYCSLMWVRQEAHIRAHGIIMEISEHHVEELGSLGIVPDDEDTARNEEFLSEEMDKVANALLSTSLVQIILTLAALAILFNVYSIMQGRERRLESEKNRAEENSRAKTIFLSNMSHDIRTPMNAIIGYLNLAKRDDITMPELRDYMEKIEGSSQHLLALINDVLEMSRIESGKMELERVDTDLVQVMDAVRDMFATQMREKHIEYTVRCETLSERWVLCDKNRLNRVLLNLISNAYKFTPEDGQVSVRLIQPWPAAGGRAAYELRVRDSGIGMTPEFAERVFEAFERERTSTVSGIQGTGLGMAITKSIVDLMGGDIRVETAPGEGTEFIVQLELECLADRGTEDETATGEKERELAVDFSTKRLLLVEDMDINREIATMLLKRQGFAVETAMNGQDALDKVKASEPGYYDAVLMDIQMPVMNGYDATRAIRALPDHELASVPVIAMTANAFTEDVRQAHEAGMNAHIAKPIDLDDMRNTLTEVLASRAAE